MDQRKPEIYKTIIAHERIRKIIEGKIHGPVSTRLLLIHQNLGRLKQSLKEKDAEESIKDVAVMEAAVLELMENHLRSICHQLYPSILSLGLSAGLQYLRSSYNKNINMSLKIDEKFMHLEQKKPPLMSEDERLFLYRIVDEALNNSVQHSNAGHVNIELLLKIKRLYLYISDYGKGFNLEDKADGPGLLAMRNYAKALKALIDIKSSPGKGTSISLGFSLSGHLK